MGPSQNGIFIRSCYDLKKDLRLVRSGEVREVSVREGRLVAGILPATLAHVSVSSTQSTTQRLTEVSVGVGGKDEIAHVHVAPHAKHCIVSSKNGDNVYVNLSSNQVHAMKKIKGVVTSVAWNPDTGSSDTSFILLSTSKGVIYETCIGNCGTMEYSKEYKLNGETFGMCDMYLHVVNDDGAKCNRWSLLACAPQRLYAIQANLDLSPKTQFTGTTAFKTGMVMMPEKEMTILHPFFMYREPFFIAAPSEWTSRSLVLYTSHSSTPERSKFAWFGSASVILGTLDLNTEKKREMVKEERRIEHRRVEGSIECPLSVSLTEYHLLLLFSTRLTVVSFYTGNVVYEDVWPKEVGVGVGLSMDATSLLHWVHTSNCMLKYRPNDEERYVWKVYMDGGQLSKALKVATHRKSIDPHAFELVLRKQADKFIAEKNFGGAAEILAQSSEPFETIVMRLISKEDEKKTGLKTLLDKKLEQLRGTEDRMRRDAIFMWLLEMQVGELAEARKELTSATGTRKEEMEERVNILTRHVHTFLMRKNVQETIRKLRDAIYRIMLNHADFESQLFVADILQDDEKTVSIRVSREQYKEALLKMQAVDSAELYYTYCRKLVEHVPDELLSALKRSATVRPHIVIPLLCEAALHPRTASHVVQYVEWTLASGGAQQSLHNVLVQLLARVQPDALMKYLTKQGKRRAELPYNIEYAIRTVKQFELREALIWLYCVGEMWKDAVQLALEGSEGSLQSAKQVAHWMDNCEERELFAGLAPSAPSTPIETRRSVWLLIARHMIDKKEGASAVLGLLSESQDALRIQDLLPLLPEFTKMQLLKDPLVQCLKEHSAKIERLQEQMREATATAAEVRDRTAKMKKRVVVVKSGDVCESCRGSLSTRPFYAHACRHIFHSDCLHREMSHLLSSSDRTLLSDLAAREQKLLEELQFLELEKGSAALIHENEQSLLWVHGKMNEIVGKECPLCCSLAIDQIDLPFFTDQEYEEEKESWCY